MPESHRPFVRGAWYATPDEKQRFLRRIFDDTAPNYERIARWGWFGTGAAYRRGALLRAGVTPEMRVLDVASGTGPVARSLMEILRSPGQIVCVEPSAGMIAESRKTVPAVHHQTTAERIPEPDASFDFLSMGFALRHVDDLDATFREFRRVLKPGGRALIMEVAPPPSGAGKAAFRLYFKHVLPALSLGITADRKSWRLMRYYYDSMEQMIPHEEILAALRAAGFARVERRTMLGCFAEYLADR